MKLVLFNPFEKFSASKLLVFGIIATLIGSYLGYVFNGRFDGVIDLHFNEETTLVQPFVDNAVNILCLSLSLFVVGRIINKKTRFIDVLIPAMIARIPFGVPLWQILLSIFLLIASTLLMVFIASKIYRVGILMYGNKATLKEIWKWIRS